MIAAVFLVLLRPLSVQCALLLLLLLLGTVATILFFCSWQRNVARGKQPVKSVLSGRSKSRGELGLRTHHFRSEGFRHSPRHSRRSSHARILEEKSNLVEVPRNEPDSPSILRKRKVKKRVLPEFYQSVQVTPTRKISSCSGNPSLHCSMSSSADLSEEEDYSVKSGSASPAPGDTLPWNLPRHERSKRKIQGGSVLDPAERAVLRIADERDRVQKKTFTKWINQHLMKVRKHINDLYEDLRDGHNLISLLEVLSGDKLPRERDVLKTLRLVSGTEACAVGRHGDVLDDDKGPRERGRMRFHRLQNVQIALDYLKRRQVKLVNIRNDDITDGNPKLTLGLIWTIILHFQISEIHVTGESQDMTAKDRLLLWSKQITEGYVGVRCDNFTTSWRDGRLFNAIIHKYRPDLVDMSRVSTQTNRSNLENAFGVAEQLGVARLLDPEDVDVQSPDEKSVITYVSTLYDAFPRVPENGDGISPNEIDIKWVEYQNMIKYLSQWIKHNVTVMNDRSFPNNPAELKALYTQYLQFKEHEIPLKENEKTKIKNFYKMLEVWIEFGRIHLPPGHHPNDVEKEWGKLIVAMLEREKSLRPEVERLETLQQIANRVQRDCVHGEDKLAVARNSLKSDVKRLESGIQFLNEAEIAGYLLECENILRQQVVDIQVLLDGKFPFTDQLVRRVSNLRDDLLFLRAECANLYSKGRTLTTEQTKMMISGITQSLNSGLSQNISLNPAFPPVPSQGGFNSSTFTSSLTPSLTPGLQSASEQTYMSSASSMEPDSLRHMTQMHIPKPLMKSSLADPSLTEEEVNMKYVEDLLKWVADMQLQLDRAEWGSDMPSVATHLDNHKSVHRAIEEFEMSLKEAKLSEIQINLPLKLTYSEKISSLEKQYEKLLSCSKERQSHLQSLHDFVSQATSELIWLNEKEEEEVAFDWSDRNSNVSKKRDYHADLMKELDEKEGVIKSVQDFAERLLFRSHPAKLTIEAYRAAMQTQWSWILQLCSCVEQHLKENAVYFEFFSDAKESMDFLRGLQDAIQRKYRCDRTSSLHRLEDLIQESMEEKEQLLQYRNAVAGLMGRAKNIVQLKPRNPDSPRRASIPVKAICDYRQIEITIYKDDECVLANNTHRAKWKVINPAGNEAMVPSVCFTVPPPNKEAVDMASKTEQLYQNVLSLWHHSHINMKSVVSWHCLMADIRTIRHWNVASFKTMLPGEHQQVLSNLQSHFDEFLEDCEESEVFTVADCAQLERDVAGCKEYYQELLKSAEREEHEESLYNRYISEIRNFRMHLEAHEEHLIRQIRTPLDRDDVYQSLQRINDQERKMAELVKFKEDLDAMKDKCEVFLAQASGLPSAPTLSSELGIVVQSMSQVQSMSSIYMDKLKTMSLVVKHSQSAEALVKTYESKLYEEDVVNSDLQSIETVISTLKQWRTEIDEKQEVFHNMEDELQKARLISDRMLKAHNERDFELDWHKEKVDQLNERWRNIHSQIDTRLRDLDGNSKSLKLYKDSYSSLDEWVREVQAEQMKAQENKLEDGKALTEVLNKQKVLVAEIEQKQSQIDECQKYSEQCSSAIKDYELQLMTFRAMVDSQHKSPLKKRKMQSSSDAIQQEFMDLRTRYTALVTLMTQYVKFASETLKRTEDEERSVDEEKREHGDKVSKLLDWMSNVKKNVSNEGNALKDSNANTDSSNNSQVSLEEMVTKKEQVAEAIRATEIMLSKHGEKMSEEEREKVQEQLENLNKAYNDLSQHCLNKPALEKEDMKSIIGNGCIWTQAFDGLSHDKISLLLPTSDLSEPESHLIWDDVLKQHAPHKSTTGNQLLEYNLESKCIDGSHVTSVSICDVATAVREASMLEDLVVKIIEFNQVSDGLNVVYSGDTVTLEMAFQEGLIPASVYLKILQRQKTCQKMMHDPSIANESHLEDMQVNRLILKCVRSNRSQTDRIVHTLTSVCDRDRIANLNPNEVNVADQATEDLNSTQEAYLSTGNSGERITVDAMVQCDLMSFSSTLIVLGTRHQFIGLVLPRPKESQFCATSSKSYEKSISDVLDSSPFSKRGEISAFYIPENTEVMDVNSAVQNGYIDVYMAYVLKSIEIPEKVLNVDCLNERFSSWLMCRKLRINGRCHAEDLFTSSETKQLFVSYLMLNSYIDLKSQHRVLILDKKLTKMVQFFLEDSVFLENLQHSMEPWAVNVSEQSDLDVPSISENSDVKDANTSNERFDDSLYIEDPDDAYDSCTSPTSQEIPVLPAFVNKQNANSPPDVTSSTNGINISSDYKQGVLDEVGSSLCVEGVKGFDAQGTNNEKKINKDLESSEVVTGNIQEESSIQSRDEKKVYASKDAVQVKSDNPNLRDEDGYDATPSKDEENSFPPNGKEEQNSDHPKEEGESDAPAIQLQIMQEMMANLQTNLRSETYSLECIKEERAEDELLAEMSCKPATKIVEEIKNSIFSTQDYLECIGRLQDHADVLDDLRKDLLIGDPTGNGEPTGKSMEELKMQMDEIQDTESSLHQEVKLKLEDVTFAIQIFVSEHAHLLSPAQSSCLLKYLSSTQRAYRDQTGKLLALRCTLDVLLDTKEREYQEKSIVERHQAISDKLEEMCDSLTLTENRLIGHQQQADNTECVTDLQQYQQEHQALQKDVLTNATALNEVISSTKKFLEENQGKLSADQIADIETKLEEANGKAKLIQKQAEESRKDLEKVVTTAIKHESEKAAAVERLEESKNKIEGLLEWVSKIGDKTERCTDEADFISKENGNLPEETLDKLRKGEKDDANGNTLHQSESGFDGQSDACMDIDKQYERVKARHQEILSQQQDLIMATQSAQALLDKQANVLSSEEKDKLQKNILELKERYDASLNQAEQQMKQVQCVQEELKKFQDDCEEFEDWLAQAEREMEQLAASAGSLKILNDKLLRQKSFSEDVISHKGDLRFITISGQKVLDVAEACGVADPKSKNGLMQVDTSGTCSAVKDKLGSAASQYKTLHTKCNQLGNNLKDIVEKYKKYDDSSTGLLKWLESAEEEARKQQSEAIAAEPKKLQIQLEDTKVLQGQMSGHQTAIDTLSKAADSLITSDGNLLSNLDEIQETVDDIVERYDNLSKAVSDRNEKLQITLTRSMSVQDGLDEMMRWMEGVEASVKENGQIPLDSASLTDMLSKETAIEQDIASRQSSIAAMKSKVKKFSETADPSSAALLQSKMDALSKRFSDTCDKHKQKVARLEEIKDKVEEFENVAENVQQFVVKRSQDLYETDGPGKTFEELAQLTQNAKAEMVEHYGNVEKLQTLSKELCEMSKDGNRAQIQSKMDNLVNIFSTFKDTVKEKDEEVSSCQDLLGEFRAAAGLFSKWLEETNEKVPVAEKSCNAKSLEKDFQIVTGLLEEWTSKGPALQDLNTRGASLCNRIASLTSPAKAKITNKTELMTIQQNMSFVNEGYSCLGDTLKRRSAELGGSVRELKDAKKETEHMMTWLEDMKKTASSWKNGATEKDAVKTQLEQQKVFEDSMKQKKEQLHKVREKLTDLIETQPNSQEADKWRQMLEEIDAAWADISGSVLERKQHLEQSNKNLDIVQSSQVQLGQWLSEKELMMSVLGPLSIDPNMLKMQKQQVQILQNEFKSRKPQFEQLKEAASAILNSSDSQDPSNGKLVRDQLATVTDKWQGLIGQLDQRDGLIDQAVVKTGMFQELLSTLGQTAAQLEDQLGRHQASSTQPDAVKKQLEDVHNISLQLREEKPKLKQAEAVHADLKAMVTEDYLKADLDRQLESVSKPFKQLEERAAKQIEQLNSTFASSQQFHQTSKDFQSWLAEKLQDQSKPRPISAKVDVLQKTLNEHRNLQSALIEQNTTYSTIAGEGETLLQSTDGAEKLALQGQLSLLSSNWQEVKKNTEVHADKLKAALQRAQKFEEHVEKLKTWVKDCETSEGGVKLTLDLVAVENAVTQAKALQKDVDKHRGMVEQMNTAAESLLELADTDTEGVKKEAASISERVDCVLEGLQNKKESLEKISYAIKEFNEGSKEAKTHLEGAKTLLDSYDSQGVHAYSNKNLTNMKAQQKSLEGVQNQLEHLTSLAKTLVVDLPDVDGVTDLLLQVDSIEKEYSVLNKRLEEKCQNLEGKLQGIGQFQNSIREMFTRFTDLDDELDSMAPVDLDLVVLKKQQENIDSFVAQLQELMVNTANAKDGCKRMLETDSSPDLLGLKRDLDALSKQCGKLMDRAKGREGQVQSTLIKLEELCGKLHRLEDQLSRAVDKDASQGAVGMETDIINQQLEAFKAFQKEDIDPLQTQLHDINSLSQGLIQNAARGTNTKKLEDDLEKINTKWNTLNKKIAERSAQLHEALLHCGRFHDALDSLLSWLTDTEELMANQKPPSAEFKVVKAQIQEQKLLQRLLDDRKPTVELIKNEGGKVVELAESEDKEKVAKEVQSLGQRWDTLLKKAENRHKQLQSILVVTQQFYETLEPLSDWLAITEKRLSNSEPLGTETSKLEDQISHHKAIEEEIMNHSKELFHAVSLGQMLKAVSSVDDKDFVQSKLDATQGSYFELQERCRRKAEMLQQALANAHLFGEDEVALMNWLSEAHTRLSEVSVEDYVVDTLEKQMAEQLALQSDIELRKKNVDQALFNGMELLKQTTGDEVVVIQGKLDGIKTKYAEITSMSDNVLNTLERVLSLSTKLHHTHEDLSLWLEKAEAQISSYMDEQPIDEQLTQAQNMQKTLLKETKDRKAVVDKLNELSSSLLDLIPWHTREGLDKLVTEDNERYRAICDSVAQQVDRINADILKSQQFEEAVESELAWLKNAENKLLSMGEIKLGHDQTAVQLQAHKVFSMDIMRHKDSVDAIVKKGKAIMSSKKPEEKELLKAKTQTLVEKYGAVSQLNSERSLQLERAQSLASQFWETYEELSPWLQETLKIFKQLPPPAIEYDALRQQQEELRQMRELIAEHKPHIDKMNKTGPQLLELSPKEGLPIREKYTKSEQLYTKLKADVKQRAAELDEAISKSTQFHDKIAPMLESLERIAERLRQPPSISVEVDKIKEQITENKCVSVDLEKLQPSYETLKQRGEEMVARSEDRELSAKAVQDKLDHMVFLWTDIQVLLEEREAKLLDVMDLAERFWCDHCALIVTIKDSQDLLRELEEPGVDPSVVKQQQEFVEGFKEEIDGFQEELDSVRNQGSELMTACGEPDKPVIKKSIDEVNSAWENLNKTWKERVERLEEAMQDAVQFQDGLQGMFDWVDILESKLDSMSPVGTDLETVKQQIVELKEYKVEAYQLQIEMERLNHQAGLLLKKVTDETDRCAIQEPMYELKMLWENLDEKIISRQHKLEGGLLALGQFQHALDELLAWMSHTEEMLNEQRKAGGDPKAIEIELAKHHVLQIDVLAHKSTVETVNKAGNDLVQSSAGEEASCLKSKLENLNQRWKAILERTEQRKQQLESALLQAQGFHGEVEDMLQWLKDTERQLLASKAVGGLPDTAREQLNAHLELCSALEVKEELYQELMTKGQQLLSITPEGNTEQDLANLKEKWDVTQAKVADRKVKLEEALTLATDFHNSLQDFINWLTQAEQTLNMVSPASLILETILFQIDEHKMFVTEVNSHRDDIIELDKTGTHLKYFSQKQDVVLIKNLLLSVQGRWEKLVQRSVERGRVLDDARKRAKQFHENWSKLMEWLDESEKTLDSEVEIANEPDKIKKQLSQHKEFQKSLGSKHSVYDTTSRTGRALKDKTSLQDDNQKLDDMLSELRDKWDTVCGKSIERQNKLEEALLFSGQFKDALQALIDWLYKVEPQMAEDQPVHGDIDLILNLIDNHKVFQKELGKKTVSVQALKRSARELIDSSHDDSSWVKVQMQELSTRWETVCNLSVSKQARLEQALCQAEEFHSTVHILLEWLAEAEQSLRFHGSLPDDEEALRALIDQHKEFMRKLEEKRVALNKAISLGEAILSICHPDSITTIKHWNTIIKARFEEVQAWARQHQQRLATALSESLATQDLLENLLTWLQWAESNLSDKDKEPLPQEIQEVKNLIAEHQAFMEEMTRKQPDVDKITKTHKRKAALEPQIHSQIPVLDKGRAGRKRSPTQTMYASATQAPIETKNPRVNLLVSKWQHVWLLALDRRRKLNDALDRLEELKEFANFDFDVWRKRYMRWMNHKKSRVMDFFRRIDKDQDGKVTRQEFIEGILSSKFPTSRLEMSAVADIFDRDGDGYIDYYEFVAALHPNKDAYKPLTDADKIEDEVTRQVAKCKCPKRFQVEQIGANKYRFYLGNQFGDSQQLRLVRILRSTVMVRVGGGWMALDEFLVKNDPCRAKGRTNMELREKFMVPEGTTQVMASFRYRGRRSRPSSPNRSMSSQSCVIPSNPAVNSTPKTCQHISRNYDKPWLTNSKPSTPIKSSDSFGSPGSSAETTPVQGSKLRLPGYLSGKGFQSSDDGTLINAAILKARGQTLESRKSSSRPGSKAGSRGSSRRGSDASDFDISDIQSVCSDASETVGDGPRTMPRSLARHHGGKPSKIPTPQRKSTSTSKLAKGSKR
nr:dystonin-like [Nerophis lumbriciformis]